MNLLKSSCIFLKDFFSATSKAWKCSFTAGNIYHFRIISEDIVPISAKIYKAIFTIVFLTFAGKCISQADKEVLIIGTMHHVPKILKNSYRPLYKIAQNYNPDIIITEHVPPHDTISQAHLSYYAWFIKIADSLSNAKPLDEARYAKLLDKGFDSLTLDDLTFLQEYHAINRDLCNYKYFQYLKKNLNAQKYRPGQNENKDVSYRLAKSKKMMHLFSMDYQQNDSHFSQAWGQCDSMVSATKQKKYVVQLGLKYSLGLFGHAIIGQVGKYHNKYKTQMVLYNLNAFLFVKKAIPPCTKASEIWFDRNFKMVQNTANIIRGTSKHKYLVVVGAGHVETMRQIFAKEYPDIKVKTMYDRALLQAGK